MKPLIFLDIDGVLNRHRWNVDAQSSEMEADCVSRFNAILKATDAEVVLSSAWRYIILRGAMNLDGFRYMLRTHGVLNGLKLIGHTCSDEDAGPIRGKQITRWLEENGRRPYVVIDDIDLGISAEGHPFVQTCPNDGLTDSCVREVVEVLAKQAEVRNDGTGS